MMNADKAAISPDTNIRDAIAKLNEIGLQILVVVDAERRLLGTVTDGDVRRGILNQIPLANKVTDIMCRDPRTLKRSEKHRARDVMREAVVAALPVVEEDGTFVDLVLLRDSGGEEEHQTFADKTNHVFILAGGKGTRLKPFTNILPKPLIPLGETPIIEVIMRRWQKFGFNKFILSVNHKADMIRMYFAEYPEEFAIEYVQEKDFLGTGGSLHLVKNRIKETLLVANCDVLLEADLNDFFEFHREHKNDATMMGVVRHVKIPYGVIDMVGGTLKGLKEKPEFEFLVNAGIYAIEPSILQRIEDGKYSEMPSILDEARMDGLRVGVYPVSGHMIDVGHWEEYEKARDRYVMGGGSEV